MLRWRVCRKHDGLRRVDKAHNAVTSLEHVGKFSVGWWGMTVFWGQFYIDTIHLIPVCTVANSYYASLVTIFQKVSIVIHNKRKQSNDGFSWLKPWRLHVEGHFTPIAHLAVDHQATDSRWRKAGKYSPLLGRQPYSLDLATGEHHVQYGGGGEGEDKIAICWDNCRATGRGRQYARLDMYVANN